ncbi:unnamed protein product [Vicia faba]|uniref:Oxidoreductase-like domain-containing protein n=1 Tax=Vicia faba TaxID=3906 RepID=A0AAV1AG59_VICFA|nr:unnamed protein product [Vicia faba]
MRTYAYDFTQKLFPRNTISTTTTNPRLQTTSPYFFLQPYPMAEPVGASNTPSPHPIQPKPDSNAVKEVPPPPEKPDPDDCCGSGCVRCVWDVYYDQLEEYDKLYKQTDPNPKP